VKKRSFLPEKPLYQETLGDAQFAVAVLVLTSCTLIIFTLIITLLMT